MTPGNLPRVHNDELPPQMSQIAGGQFNNAQLGDSAEEPAAEASAARASAARAPAERTDGRRQQSGKAASQAMQLAAATTLAPGAFSLAIIALGINGGAHDEKWIRVSAVAAGAAGSGEDCWIDRGSLHSERTCCPSPTGETPCNPLGEWLEAVLASGQAGTVKPLA